MNAFPWVAAEQSAIDALAPRMLRDYDAKTPGTVFADGARLSLEDARRLQNAVTRLREQRGEKVVGYKIGCVCPGNQQRNGLTHPVWGRLWSSEQFPDDVRLEHAGFANLAIEGEFAVTLGRDIEPGQASLEAIVAAVDFVLPVIELHNVVFHGTDPKGAELIANNAIHAGVVRGSGRMKPGGPMTTDLSIRFDGKVVDAWTEIRWPDNVLQAVGWLADCLRDAGLPLSRGQTILTGALGPPLPVADVSRVEVHSSQFGAVAASFI